MVIHEWWIGKELEGSGNGLILRHYPGIRLEELIKTTKILIQDSLSLDRYLNLGPPEYKAEVLKSLDHNFQSPGWSMIFMSFGIKLKWNAGKIFVQYIWDLTASVNFKCLHL
jgi:hypothetical protein